MPNTNNLSIGRFSSQILSYLGVQRSVKTVNGVPTNTYKYEVGPIISANPSSSAQSYLGVGVVGYCSPSAYDSTKSYFLSRGASVVYADAMTALLLDTAFMLGVSPQLLLEKSDFFNNISFTDNAYRAFNNLRDTGNQVGYVKSVDNKKSFQANQIRP